MKRDSDNIFLKKNIVIIHPNPIYEKKKKRKKEREKTNQGNFCTYNDQHVRMAYRARKKCWKIFEKGVTMTVRPSIGGEKAHSARFSIVARVILPHSHPWCRHFFFPPPFFSNHHHHHHHHRKLSWSAKHFFPWIWMRADAWNEARFVGWKLFNDRAKRQLELDGRGTYNHPLQLFTPNFSDLLANLASHTYTHMDFFFNVIDRPIELVKILWGIVLEGVGEGARKERTRMCFVIAWSLDGTRIVLSEDEIDWRKWITFLFYWFIRVCDLFFYALLIFLYKNRSCRKKKKKKLKFLCVLMLY